MTLISEQPSRRLDPALVKLAAVLLTGVLAVLFDTTIVSVALRTLVTQLHVPVSTIQWVTTGYLLALGDPGERTAGRLDVAGLALLSPGIALVLFGLSRVGATGGFGHLSVVLPAVGGALLVGVFVVRALRMRGAALVDVRLFRVPAFAASTALLFLSGFVLYGAMLVMPLYFQ